LGSLVGFALDIEGILRAFGFTSAGSAGLGDGSADMPPTQIQGLTTVKQAAAGGGFGCALQTDNTVRCWGENARGQVGNGTSDLRFYVPVQALPVNP
jgi:alpha-tubulin suppressor-like RCC1 family protein